MNTLFISTYSNIITISVLKDGIEVIREDVASNQTHSTYLLNTIKSVINKGKLIISDINEIIAVKGPGSFTGTRLGLVVAKTLAFTLDIPIKTITSIEALGASNDAEVITIKDSKGVYYGKFKNNKLISNIDYSLNSKFKYEISENLVIDVNKIYNSLSDNDYENVHLVNADYIKKLDGINDN